MYGSCHSYVVVFSRITFIKKNTHSKTPLTGTASSPGASSTSPKKSYEVTELAYKFIGPFGKYAYQVSLAILMYAGLLAYAQVFVSSILLMIPSEYHYSWMNAVIASVFAVLVVPLSTIDITEQVFVQTVMALTMQISIAVIVASCVIAIYVVRVGCIRVERTHTLTLSHTHTHRILPMVIVTWRAMVMKTTNPRSSQTVFDLQISRTRIVF